MKNLILYDIESGRIVDYPRDDDEPVVQLDPRYRVLRIVRQDKPVYDPATQGLRETRTVDLNVGEWQWGWEVVNLPPAAQRADWSRFKRVVMAHPQVNLALGGGLGQAPAAAMALPATVIASAAGGDVDDFRAAWLALRRVGLISAGLLAEVRALAIECHLPEVFVAALGGATRPTAEVLGQEWIAADGTLWRVVQARDPDGAFAEDDPATAERESLEWVEVTT